MKTFKDVMNFINITFSSALFGAGIMRMIVGDYKAATFMLLIVAILFIVSYFAERYSD